MLPLFLKIRDTPLVQICLWIMIKRNGSMFENDKNIDCIDDIIIIIYHLQMSMIDIKIFPTWFYLCF